MSPEERDRVIALAAVPGRPSMSNEEFLDRFGATDGVVLGLGMLKDARDRRDSVEVELALIVAFIFGFCDEHVSILNSLAFEGWHESHEDIASALGDTRSPTSVPALLHLAVWIPGYLGFDEHRALATKATWALKAIGTNSAQAALRQLAAQNDKVVGAEARARLEG